MWSRLRPLAVAAVPAASWQLRPARAEEPAFKPARLVKTEAHTHDTRKVTFEGSVGKASIVNVKVRAKCGGGTSTCCGCCGCGKDCACPKKANGCCACCKCPDDKCGCPKGSASGEEVRMYNPLSVHEDGTFTLLVKKYPESKMGTHIHNLKVGDSLEVLGPNKQFQVPVGKYNQVVLLAGGTGITPLVQAAEFVLRNDKAKVLMVCANKTVGDKLLVPDLNALCRQYGDRLTVKHVVEEKGWMGGEEKGTMTEALPRLLPKPAEDVFVLVCGRPPMTAAVAGPKTKDFKQGELAGTLKELGFTAAQVWKV